MAKKAARPPVKKSTGDSAGPSVKFGPAKKKLASLRKKLQAILDKEGANPTITDIIHKIDELDRVLICQVDMTRSF